MNGMLHEAAVRPSVFVAISGNKLNTGGETGKRSGSTETKRPWDAQSQQRPVWVHMAEFLQRPETSKAVS